MFLNHFTNPYQQTLYPEGSPFFTPNGCSGARHKENLSHINAIFADWDFKPKEVTGDRKPDYKQFMLDLDGLPTPSFVVESGNGWHLYWLLEESIVVTDENREELTAQVEGIHRFIHEKYGSDSGAMDVLRLMRLPGYEHKKQPEHPFMVKVIEENDDRYTLEELMEVMPPVYKETVDLPPSEDDFDIRQVAIDAWAERGDTVEFDTVGRLIWNGKRTGTFIGRNGGQNYIATTSMEFPYKGNATTYSAGVLGITTKEAYRRLVKNYGERGNTEVVIREEVREQWERITYKKKLEEAKWDDKDWVKQLNVVRNTYALAFHHYLAEKNPHLLYERGDDKSYWNYNEATGIYDDVTASLAKGIVLALLEKEDLMGRATEAFTKDVLARYRASYPNRGRGFDEFDENDNLFHANNGWVNLKTLEFTPHTASLYSRRKSAVDYVPGAKCPVYDKFLDKDLGITPDKVRVIDQFSGLCLTNDIKYQKMLTLLGRPGCGKSTLLDAWSFALGEKAIEKKLTELQGESMRFAGSQFAGASLCWFDEVDVKKAEMGNSLGTLITGSYINIERKGINGITKARNTVKCVLTANRLPMAAELGIYRRLIMINLPNSFTETGNEDREMAIKLREESSGILNRMIKGLQDLTKMHGFTVIDGHEDLIEEYKAQSDTMAEFLDTFFEPASSEDFIETQVLYDAYQHFAEGNSFTRSITPQKFGRLLSTQPLNRFSKVATKRTQFARGWTGLKLKNEYKFHSESHAIEEAFRSNF